MNHSLEGSCQCGEVHYQIKGEPLCYIDVIALNVKNSLDPDLAWVCGFEMMILKSSEDPWSISKGLPIAEERWNVSFAAIVGSRIFHKTLNKNRITSSWNRGPSITPKHFNPPLIFGSRVNRHGSYLQMKPLISKDHGFQEFRSLIRRNINRFRNSKIKQFRLLLGFR